MKSLTGPHVPLRLRLALLLALCAGTTALFGVAAAVVAGIWVEPARVRTEATELAGTLGTALGLLISLALARRTARRITDPVAALAEASTAIAETKHYSQRLLGGGDDEVGQAVSAFNRMLDELQARDQSLETAVATLESR